MLEFRIISGLIIIVLHYFILGAIALKLARFKKLKNPLIIVGLTLVLGLIISLFLLDLYHNVLTIFCTLSGYLSITLERLFIASIVCSTIILTIISMKNKLHLKSISLNGVSYKYYLSGLLLILMILTIVLINISLHSVAPSSDTALFLDQARSLLSNGRINSNVLHSTMPGYYSISPQHIYVPFYYAQFMIFLGPSYETAKIANIFATLLTVLVLFLLATLINGYRAGLLSAFLCLLTPRLWTFGAFPLNGSEIIATLQVLTFFLLLEKLDLEIVVKPYLCNYFLLALIAYSIARTRFDYFSLVFPLIFSWFMVSSLGKTNTIRNKIANFFMVFTTCAFFVLLIRLSVSVSIAFFIFIFGAVGVILGKFMSNNLKVVTIFNISLLCLLSMPSIIALHLNYEIAGSAYGQLLENPITNISLIKIYSLNEMLDRIKIFSGYLIETFPLTLWILFFVTVVNALQKMKEANIISKSLPIILFVTLYVMYISISVIDFPQGFDKHRFFVLSYFLIIYLQSIFITNFLSKKLHTPLRFQQFRAKIKLKVITVLLTVILFLSPLLIYDVASQWMFVQESYIIIEKIDAVPHLKIAYQWLKENANSEDIILTRKPYEAAWYTEKRAILILVPDDYELFRKILKSYNITYILVDKLMLDSFKNNLLIKNLYQGKYPLFLKLILRYEFKGSFISLYKFQEDVANS